MINNSVKIKIDLQLSLIPIPRNKKKDKNKKLNKNLPPTLTFTVPVKHRVTLNLLILVRAQTTTNLLKEITSLKQTGIKTIKLIDQFLKLKNKVNSQTETIVFHQIREKHLKKNLELPL